MMKRILLSILVLCGILPGTASQLFAHVEKIHYLKTKIGERDMALRMLIYDETPTRYITYFFLDDKVDKHLIGKQKDGQWFFKPSEEAAKNLNSKLSLSLIEGENGIWIGAFTDTTTELTKVVLEPLLRDSFRSKFDHQLLMKEADPYEAYRLANITLTKIRSERKSKDLQCDWFLEKESGISFFRLKSSNKKFLTDSINTQLESMNLSMVQRYFTRPQQTQTEVLFLTKELLSFKITLGGGASSGRQLITLGVASGAQVSLEDLLWLDKPSAKPSSDNLQAVYQYRKTVFAPKVFSILQELYPEKMKAANCGINQVETWALPVWALTEDGIKLALMTGPECDVFDWAVIPYQKLQAHLTKKYKAGM